MMNINILTRTTLVMAGMEAKRAFTTILNPSFLLTILNGLSARKALNAFRLFKVDRSVSPLVAKKVKYKSTNDASTTAKSRIFHPFFIYASTLGILFHMNPSANIFNSASIRKIMVNTMSIMNNDFARVE